MGRASHSGKTLGESMMLENCPGCDMPDDLPCECLVSIAEDAAIAEFRESLDFEPCGCSDPWGWIAETPDPKPKPVAIPVPYTCWKCSETYFGQHYCRLLGGYAW